MLKCNRKKTISLKLRGSDDWGDGSFLAPRGDKSHKGVDFVARPGDELLSPVSGRVSKLGYPYPFVSNGFNYRYVQITDYKGNRHRFFYVEPVPATGLHIKKGDLIGIAQNISEKFTHPKRRPMKNHIHYEIIGSDGNLIDPMEFENNVAAG
jgi:murein DD-endopeptidase MepM/ murein hydrolase activator NlpD